MKADPIIIIGAPRSGTNMLRDILCKFDSISTWPCDEINYIWRHGNLNYPSDELPDNRVTKNIRDYVLNQFDWVSDKYEARYVVEKTCANSLRVSFVDEIIPNARYIYIVRDGLDVVGSAKLRWTAKLDMHYIIKKVRFVPLADLPFYAFRYFKSRVHRLLSSEKRLDFWGPRLDHMDEIMKSKSLEEICALQWKKCVDQSDHAFNDIPNDRVISIKYEELVRSPKRELDKILSFIGISIEDDMVRSAVYNVSDKSVGKGRGLLNEKEIKELAPIIQDTMLKHGYPEN